MHTGHVFERTCSICGGTGLGRIEDTAAEWYGAKLVHNNPEVCRRNLERRAKALEAKEQAVVAHEKA